MWPEGIHRELAAAGVRVVGYVPDAGHKRLIELCRADRKMRAVVLTTEEEGIGLAAGAWLGGQRSALLMQSSGVGNIVNVLGMVRECRFPLVTLVTMRGEQGEFNPWQVPMGQAVRPVLEAMGTVVHHVEEAAQVAPVVNAALRLAFGSYASVAVLISQRLIGIKSFQEQADR
ncbi:MAG TPA: thiamine pyrophosphate-binding protein [Burkholderiales bacterium]|nr:thiamine pyrophosphate-binding protein [Burkholderiales bacterium]